MNNKDKKFPKEREKKSEREKAKTRDMKIHRINGRNSRTQRNQTPNSVNIKSIG